MKVEQYSAEAESAIQAQVAQMHTRETLIREPSNISLTFNDLVFIMFYQDTCDIDNNAEKNISVSNVVFTLQFGRISSDGEHTRFSSCFEDFKQTSCSRL